MAYHQFKYRNANKRNMLNLFLNSFLVGLSKNRETCFVHFVEEPPEQFGNLELRLL